jgi:hypothetical protein
MLLRELFYNDNDTQAVSNDMRYDPAHDTSPMKRDDTRKTRLTLGQLNQLRKASDSHILEQEKELEFVQKMYKTPAEAPQ